eukprot:4230542-Pleurochrysis_carterae.AAC.3
MALLRRACPPPQGHDSRPTPCGRVADLARASPLSCALNDALDRTLESVAKLRLLTAAGCLALVLLHCYCWMLGHRFQGLREPANSTLIYHASRVDFGPA